MWKSLGPGAGAWAAYLRLLAPGSLPGLFKHSLTAALLRGMAAAALADLAPSDPAHALGLLRALPNVPRFEMTAMCLPAREKQALGQQWDAAVAGLAPDVGVELQRLRVAYKV